MVTVNCFVLYVIDWGVGIVRWWTVSRLRQWNCKWCLVISSFHEPSCLHWFYDGNIIRPCQFSFPFVLLFSLVATYFLFISEDRSIANDVFASYNLLVVLLLSTPHCRWCFCSYPSVSIHCKYTGATPCCSSSWFYGEKRLHIAPAGRYSLQVTLRCIYSATSYLDISLFFWLIQCLQWVHCNYKHGLPHPIACDVAVYYTVWWCTCDVYGRSLLTYTQSLHVASFIYVGLNMYGWFYMLYIAITNTRKVWLR